MKIRIIFGFLLLFPILSFSQGEHNIWYFGNRAGLDFNSGSPVVLQNASPLFESWYNNFCQSDSLGNLLFYLDENKVFDRNHNMMPNGGAPAGWARGRQSSFAVRDQINKNLFFLFTMDGSYGADSHGLTLAKIDMTLNGGLGDIIPGQYWIQIYYGSHTSDLITGIRHQNNKDTWILVKDFIVSNHYYSYLINASGLDTIPVISNGLSVLNNTSNHGIQLRISPDGNKLIMTTDSISEFCHFNTVTGVVTPLFGFNISSIGNSGQGGVEFSYDSKYLYVHQTNNPGSLRQFDATLTDSALFMQSAIFLGNNQTFSFLMMGPDHKIYLSEENKDSLSVINFPSLPAPACGFQRNAIWTKGRICRYGLPQFLQTYYVKVKAADTCDGVPVSFTTQIWPPADSIRWNFGDPASGANNLSQLPNPVHQFTGPGIWNVTVIAYHDDKRIDTVHHQVTIYPVPAVDLGPDRTICNGNSYTFDAGSCTGCAYEWKDVNSGLIVGNAQTFMTSVAGKYCVIVSNTHGCSGSDTIQLFTTPVPQVTNNPPLIKSICSGEYTGIQLLSNVPTATFTWTASLTSGNINGFSLDSGLVINQLLVNHFTTPGIVTYHITPKVGSCTGTAVDFQVTVNPIDTVKVTIVASANNICAGTPVTFTATLQNPGASPVYHWKLNGGNAGGNSTTFTHTPSNGDQVSCILASSITPCDFNNPATSNTITMIVNPNLPVSVSVSASANPVCSGSSVTFTAVPTNGGTTPLYQWKVNGTNFGAGSSVFSYTPGNGDIITCTLTSSEICKSGNPAISSQITMVVNPNMPVSVGAAASNNPVCAGIPVTFTATSVNGGSSPIFQWFVNGSVVGSNIAVYSYSPQNGDIIICSLNSNITCPSGNPASSAPISMTVSPSPQVTFISCIDSITTINAKPFRLKGGFPLNGTYSGPGVNSVTGFFNPLSAGTGTKTITYSYTNSAICNASKTRNIIVQSTAAFACGNNLIDIRENKPYPTVQIGTQCWMASNLNYGKYISSSLIQVDNCIAEKYCYDDNSANCNNYGAHYQWDEMMQYDDTPANQGLCPPGWHVPNESDWQELFTFYRGKEFAGVKLQDLFINGFQARRVGVNSLNSGWNFIDFASLLWSSTSWGQFKALSHGMNIYDFSVSLYPSSRANAFSVRCLRD